MNEGTRLRSAIDHLYRHIEREHWNGRTVVGPDVGLRWDFRVLRFMRSYLGGLPPMRKQLFLQTQGYWIRANWRLFEAGEGNIHREHALACSDAILELQQDDGTFPYPLRERRHLKATVESCFAGVGLIESWRRTHDDRYLAGAKKVYRSLVDVIGFQKYRGTRAINYFDVPRGNIPNNTVDALWFFGELASATGEARWLEHAPDLAAFLAITQLENGELPYNVESPFEARKEHYLCFQYNAFQYVKLARFHDVTLNATVGRILGPLAGFLEGGITPGGHCKADCSTENPQVPYWSAILGEALLTAGRTAPAAKLFATVLAAQRRDGGFDFSRRDAHGLRDCGSYPRNQVMILDSLLELETRRRGNRFVETLGGIA